MPVTPAEFCARDRETGCNPGATAEQIESAERALGVRLPDELRDFLRYTNGFDGFVGPPGAGWYLAVSSTADLIDFLDVPDNQRPELVFFGGDGGGEALFFDPTRPGPPILMIPLIGNWHEDAIDCGVGFGQFFDRLHAGWTPFDR